MFLFSFSVCQLCYNLEHSSYYICCLCLEHFEVGISYVHHMYCIYGDSLWSVKYLCLAIILYLCSRTDLEFTVAIYIYRHITAPGLCAFNVYSLRGHTIVSVSIASIACGSILWDICLLFDVHYLCIISCF